MKITNIATLNSRELLAYSQQVHKDRKALTKDAYSIITKSIDARREQINSGADKLKECEMSRMIKRFKR